MDLTSILLTLLAILLFMLSCRKDREKKFPNGPSGIPIFGNLFQLGKNIHLVFYKWAYIYGDIFSIRLGNIRAVVINNPKLIREMYQDLVFCGRPQNVAFQKLSLDGCGIGVAQGQHWEEQRRFTLRHLRDLGFGRSEYLESLVAKDVQEVVSLLKTNEGQPISVNNTFSLAILNSLLTIVSGKRYSISDPILSGLLEKSMGSLLAVFDAGILMFFPWVRHILPKLSGWTNLCKSSEALANFINKIVTDHNSENFNDDSDFIDRFLQKIKETDDEISSFYKNSGEKYLRGVVGDLLQAGSDTTSKTLSWAILFATAQPNVQKKLQLEIDNVIGRDRLPSLADREKMVYTESFLQEVFRKASITPIGVIHVALEDKEFHGYMITKGTYIFNNAYFMHHNEKLWTDPHSFKPERFLNEDETQITSFDSLMPFSVGKRICIGENLARSQLFLFITSIFQRFDTKPCSDESKFDLEGNFSYIMAPKNFKVIVSERK